MMTMKKLFVALVAVLASAMVQKADAQLLDFEGMPPYKLGITVGMNVPTFSGGGYDYTLGLNAGVDLMVDASDIFDNTFGRAVVRYSMKGANGPDPQHPDVYNGKNYIPDTHFTSHYLEIPVHYGYAWYLDSDWTIMGETGPYFAIGLGGTARPDDETILGSHSFFNSHDVSRWDIGWGLQCSLLYDQQWQVHVAYDWGFKNMNDYFLQNNGLSVGVTLYFEY
jgi:hypothetical protein